MTMAVTIAALPVEVWPWLAQIGYQRGGLYSYDWLDRLFGFLDGPSAIRILPEFQDLKVGDVIPLGAGPGWPVAGVETNRSLVLAPATGDFLVSWAFVLTPMLANSTRLVTRVRASYERTPITTAIRLLLDPTSFIMTRKMLLGIKSRAERTAA